MSVRLSIETCGLEVFLMLLIKVTGSPFALRSVSIPLLSVKHFELSKLVFLVNSSI